MGFSITKDEYEELLKCAERIEAVKRLVYSGVYITPDSLLAVLGIQQPAKTEGKNGEL